MSSTTPPRFGQGTATLPAQARVVVIGGGIVGASVLYHLTERGWTDVVLLERKRLTSGTTWHAAGLVGQFARDVQHEPPRQLREGAVR